VRFQPWPEDAQPGAESAAPPLTHFYKDSRPLCDQDGDDVGAFTGSLNWSLVTCETCLKSAPPLRQRCTNEWLEHLRTMMNEMLAGGHRTIWSLGSNDLVYFTFNGENARKAAAALDEAGCLCPTVLGPGVAGGIRVNEDIPDGEES
jgi:hypothetical protein